MKKLINTHTLSYFERLLNNKESSDYKINSVWHYFEERKIGILVVVWLNIEIRIAAISDLLA